MSSTSKKKANEDFRNRVSEAKRVQTRDINRLALQPSFELGYSPIGVGTIDFVNVTTAIGPGQGQGIGGDTTPPGQVTGLTATAASSSVINTNWTARTEPDLDHYNVYRGTAPGFSVVLGSTTPASSPTTNSFSDTGRTASTTYYYRVSAVDATGNLGTLSTEANATTPAGPPPLAQSLWLELNNSFTDSSGNGSVVTNGGTTFATPGKFGSHYAAMNLGGGTGDNSVANYFRIASNTNIRLDTTVGFSISFWMNLENYYGSGAYKAVILHKTDSTSTPNDAAYAVEIWGDTPALVFIVGKAGTFYRAQATGIAIGTWYHIACTFDGATNTPRVYKDAVVGTSSSHGVVGAFGTTTTLYVGKHPNDTVLGATGVYFSGFLDELQYFKGTVLSQTQVTNLKNTNAP